MTPGTLTRKRMPPGFAAPADRTIGGRPAVELVLLCDPFGELVAQTFVVPRVEFVRYADGSVMQRGAKGAKHWHKMVSDEQLAAVLAEFERASAMGKPYANDWSPAARVPWWHTLEREPTVEEYRAYPVVPR